MTKTRIPLWDNVKGILISFVVLGHVLQVDIENGGGDSVKPIAVVRYIFLSHAAFLFYFWSFFKKHKSS